ncbi:MAG TPA: VanZ family protein [Azonexus sp.]|nr:VanZ family protein [Azonexus sp.]
MRQRQRRSLAGVQSFSSTYLFAIACLISYGSLYPFSFSPASEGAFAKLFLEWDLFSSRGDVLGNIGLFVPWGLFGILALFPKRSFGRAVTWTIGLGCVLAFILQVIQVWIPARSASIGDVVWNVAGCLLGTGIGRMLATRPRLFVGLSAGQVRAAYMLGLWLVIEWLPLVPSLDFQLFKQHVRDLLSFGSSAAGTLCRYLALGVFVGELSAAIVGMQRSWILQALFIAACLLGKFVIVDVSLSSAMPLGLAAGFVGWLLLRRLSEDRRLACIAVALCVGYTIDALAPFALKVEPSAFGWLPFDELLQGSMLTNLRSLVQNLFVYAAILFCLQTVGANGVVAAIGLAFWVLVMEIAQGVIATRTAALTEPLLVAFMGPLIQTAWQRLSSPNDLPDEDHPVMQARQSVPPSVPVSGMRANVLSILATVFLIAVSIKLVLQLPNIPYNVRELFRDDGNLVVLAIFALAVLWIGAGSAWFGRTLAVARYPEVMVFPLSIVVSMISLTLIWWSATSESIGDIVGAADQFRLVTKENAWGEVWRDIFLTLDAPERIGFVETCVRYWALFAPVVLVLGMMIFAHERWKSPPVKSARTLPLLVMVLLILWLCKAICFDWSSTDNLYELIARDGAWGLGGGGFLYGLLFLISLNALEVAELPGQPRRRTLTVVVSSIAALPVGWWLLNQGVDQAIEKYGQIFSGVQFLLGPDRSHLLSQDVLFWRWCVVQLAVVATMGLGVHFGKSLPLAIRSRT